MHNNAPAMDQCEYALCWSCIQTLSIDRARAQRERRRRVSSRESEFERERVSKFERELMYYMVI